MCDGAGAMAYLDVETLREREAQWRQQAADLAPGAEQAVCLALAEGYADLIALIRRPPFGGTASADSTLMHPAPPARVGSGRRERPRSDSLPEAV
jgi:hypothetical protein